MRAGFLLPGETWRRRCAGEGHPAVRPGGGDPLCDFDIIGFSLGYEMAYTNVLNMLDLAGLPLRSEEQRDLAPLVVAGGDLRL